VYLELERDPKINIIELLSAKRDHLSSYSQVKILEIEASEYMSMKQKIKDLEIQNALLSS
jgi:hypothetical protein